MNPHWKLRALQLALVVGLSPIAMAATPDGGDTIDPQDTCVEVDAWIEAHRDSLPRVYTDFGRLPMNYRRRVYDHLSFKAKSDLWRAHVARALETETLTGDQQAFLKEALGLLAPEFFSRSAPGPSSDRMRELFGHDPSLYQRLFRQIGPATSAAAPVPEPDGITSCACCYNCGGWFPSCTFRTRCMATECNHTQSGCGDWGEDACNGQCCSKDGAVCI